MKRLLLLFLILSSNLFAEQGETILILPQNICELENPDPYTQVDIEKEIAAFEAQLAQEAIEKEIAEFEANLAKDLADQSKLANDAQVAARMEELALEQELKAFEAKAKFSPTVCEITEDDYEAWVLYRYGIK